MEILFGCVNASLKLIEEKFMLQSMYYGVVYRVRSSNIRTFTAPPVRTSLDE